MKSRRISLALSVTIVCLICAAGLSQQNDTTAPSNETREAAKAARRAMRAKRAEADRRDRNPVSPAADASASPSAAQNVEENCRPPFVGPYACPQFPLMSDPGGTLYYCDRYSDNDPCPAAPEEADYLYGDFPWPTPCSEYCVGSGGRDPKAAFVARTDGIFRGLKHFVNYNYKHTWTDDAGNFPGLEPQLAGQERKLDDVDSTCLPGGAARLFCRVDLNFPRQYLTVDLPNEIGNPAHWAETVHAKVVRFEFDKSAASGGPVTNPRPPYYVAFQVNGDPVANPNDPTDPTLTHKGWLRGRAAYGKINIPTYGVQLNVLILLKQ